MKNRLFEGNSAAMQLRVNIHFEKSACPEKLRRIWSPCVVNARAGRGP